MRLRPRVRPGGRVALLVFVKEGRRNSFHAHHDSLAGHVLDVRCDEVFHEQLGGWVERRLKLTPRGYLMTRLRFEKAETYAPSGVALTTLAALRRSRVRARFARLRLRVLPRGLRGDRGDRRRWPPLAWSYGATMKRSTTTSASSGPSCCRSRLAVTRPSG